MNGDDRACRTVGLKESWKHSMTLMRSPGALLATGFVLVILAGTALLCTPWAVRGGAFGLLDALFTSTSAVCVTGLVVVDTGTTFTPFGQVLILALIQLGGLGIMTYAALAFGALGFRLPLSSQAALEESLASADMLVRLREAFSSVMVLTFVTELLGAAVMVIPLSLRHGAAAGAWSACFHSISAFCNAGFSLYADSMTALRGEPIILSTVAILVILGGLGHTVLYEVGVWLRSRLVRTAARSQLSFNGRVVLLTSGLLILLGSAAIAAGGLTADEQDIGQAASAALFQSISARTAGFNTVSIGALPQATLVVLCVLMFIGGSPGSCAGGIKTTSLAAVCAWARSAVRGEGEARLLGRTIPVDALRRAALVVTFAALWNLVGVFLLLLSQPRETLADCLCEQLSAFGTVGLSTGLTPRLTSVGRLWIIATMFVGRLGPLTLMGLAAKRAAARVSYPEGRVMIG